jgi:hypothetical protein
MAQANDVDVLSCISSSGFFFVFLRSFYAASAALSATFLFYEACTAAVHMASYDIVPIRLFAAPVIATALRISMVFGLARLLRMGRRLGIQGCIRSFGKRPGCSGRTKVAILSRLDDVLSITAHVSYGGGVVGAVYD